MSDSRDVNNTTAGQTAGVAPRKNDPVDVFASEAKLVWNKKVKDAQLSKFQEVIEKKYQVQFGSYWDLHKWSIENHARFWEEIWHFYGIISSQPYKEVVRDGKSFTDVEWFPGARLNYAENLLKFRDDHLALICLDEEGKEEKVTYAEMYEEVKMYAAALKNHGLRKGDKIACFMPNRKEAIFAMLAAASLGAVWGGPKVLSGAKAASTVINMMNSKILFTVDKFTYDKVERNLLQILPEIVNGISSIEKVVIVPSREESFYSDIPGDERYCFLAEFLAAARNPDGTVSDLTFEQLPFDHPLFINFTSGTTGAPKAIAHRAGVFLSHVRDFGLHFNFTRDDIFLTICSVGWGTWNVFMGALFVGATLLLFNGLPHFLSRHAFWDIMDKYKVSFAFFIPSFVDKMEKENIEPAPGCELEHLRMISIGSSHVKPQNIEYFLGKVKRDVIVSCAYGVTEILVYFSGCDCNSPLYAAEIQCPALGVDFRCLDDDGNSIIGQIGEVAIATPTPSFLLYLWNDSSKERLRELYLSKYPGVWCPNDRCWINPHTRGIKVIGRSDESLNPLGVTFSSGDIYFAIHNIKEISDSLCVPQFKTNGEQRVVLFVKMAKGSSFTPELAERLRKHITKELTFTHMVEVVLEAPDIPYNFSDKKAEAAVKKIIAENKVPEGINVRNTECLEFFCNIPQLQNY